MAMSVIRDDRGARGRGRGRGRGAGRGSGVEDAFEDMDIIVEEPELGDEHTKKASDGNPDHPGRVAWQVNRLEHPTQHTGTISPLAEQEKKRPRKSGDGVEEEQNISNARSALSFKESGRAQ